MNNRVVITGIGVVSSIGIGKDEFWKNLLAGKSGVSKVTAFDTTNFPTHYGAEVKNFEPEKYLAKDRYPAKDRYLAKDKITNLGRASQMALVAGKLALEDAGLGVEEVAGEEAGVIVGTTMGEARNIEEIDKTWVEQGEDFISPEIAQQYPADNICSNLAKALNLNGTNLIIPCACAAGNYAIGYAYDMVKTGRSKIILAGGADPFSRIAFTGFSRLLSMASEKCRPFDKNREGIILGEGAGIVVLEPLEAALNRDANIYAEVLGYGLGCDAYHMTAPQFSGIISAILLALKNSKVDFEEVNYISAHGTGTPANDRTECLALKKIFGGHLKDIPVSSSKSMLGHTMGAASAIEAIACALAITYDYIPPTTNYETPDPDCDIDCVPNVCRERRVNIALNNGFAFGGNNACLVLKKY